jgi:23S rRNA (guanosine2251-2'-O)-methyltransferase
VIVKPSKKVKPAKQDVSELYVIAHNIRSLHNVGSIFRAADGLGVSKVYLTGYTGTPEGNNAKHVHKVALGAEEFVPWEQTRSLVRLITKLRKQGVRMVALENNKDYKITSLYKYKPKFPMALILGEEVKGHTKKILDLMDDIVEIPMHGQKESLNVSVAAGVAMYALRAK